MRHLPGHTKPPSLDHLIMLNAHEEALLPHMLADLRQRSPVLTEPQAIRLLQDHLAQLVRDGRVGCYAIDADGLGGFHDSCRNLSVPEALQLIGNDASWELKPNEEAPLYHLLAIDLEYWGQSSDAS